MLFGKQCYKTFVAERLLLKKIFVLLYSFASNWRAHYSKIESGHLWSGNGLLTTSVNDSCDRNGQRALLGRNAPMPCHFERSTKCEAEKSETTEIGNLKQCRNNQKKFANKEKCCIFAVY